VRHFVKFLAASAAALALGATANAATLIEPWTTSPTGAISVTIGDNGLDVPGSVPSDPAQGTSTHVYNLATGEFTDTFNFFLPTGVFSSAVISVGTLPSNSLTFSSISFNGATGSAGGSSASIQLQPTLLGGQQQLIITGVGGPDATYGGNASFNPRAPIPEPATWGLMIVGFGGIGAMARRRRHGTAFA